MTISPKELNKDIYIRIAKACAYTLFDPQNYQLILFGSRALGTNKKSSDYDFGILGKTPLDPKSYYFLKSLLDALPVRTDLVDFTNPSLNPKFKDIALDAYIVL